MQQIPSWEATTSSASQEIPSILLIPKVHYSVQKRPLPVRILSQDNPVHAFPSNFIKIHFNIIFSFTPRSLSFSSFHQNSVRSSPISHIYHVPRPFLLLHLVIKIIFVEELLVVESASLPRYLFSPTPTFLLSTLFSNTLSLLSSLHVSDQVSHTYKRTGKITVLHESSYNRKKKHRPLGNSSNVSLMHTADQVKGGWLFFHWENSLVTMERISVGGQSDL